eukprot:scaffold1771_cov172-Amphora_coffeaeformis.AAC.24
MASALRSRKRSSRRGTARLPSISFCGEGNGLLTSLFFMYVVINSKGRKDDKDFTVPYLR